MNKEKLEKFCRDIGLSPESRVTLRKGEILIADGLLNGRGKASLIKRGAFDIGDFPDGVYMTIWFLAEGEWFPLSGRPLFFEKNHDPHLDEETKKAGRLQACLENAVAVMKMTEGVRGTA